MPTPEDFSTHFARWERFARGLVRTLARKYRVDADDLFQETALAAVKRFQSFNENRAGFGTWISFIARGTAYDVARRLRPTTGSANPTWHADPRCPDPAEVVADAEGRERAARRVRAAMAALTPRQRTAVRKRFGLGREGAHDYADIDPARVPEANRQLVRRGLDRLRQRLAG